MNDNEKQTNQLQRPGRFIITDPLSAQIQFIDFVITHADAEKVVLVFIQKLPSDTKPGSSEEIIDGRIVAQIAVTWPHLVRIRDLFDRIIKDKHSEVIQTINKIFEGEEEEEENEE
ncbi:MAG: hypothetical protein STSR0004_19520 [Peptococcaceae bacterium]